MNANETFSLAAEIKDAIEERLKILNAHLSAMEYKSAELHSIALEIDRRYGQAQICIEAAKAQLEQFLKREQGKAEKQSKEGTL